MTLLSLLSLGSSLLLASAQWTADPLNPPAVPLAVRTPFLSAWLPDGPLTALNGAWPQFWTGSTLGWAGFVNVDGTSYSFLGAASVPGATFSQATQKNFSYTSTQSTFVMTAGGVDLTVNFLSPVVPDDLLRQSIPFSYMTLSAAANDGGSHAVSVYTDISGEWITGDDTLEANWTTTTGDIITHQVQLVDQTTYAEIDDRIQQGSAYYSVNSTTGTTYQTGQDVVVRAQFIANGTLADTEDTNFRAVSDDWPVFALAQDLGNVTDATDPVVFTIGHIRDPAIQYIIADDQFEARSIYFWGTFNSSADVIAFAQGDYANALATANTFDAKVQSDASAISDEYAALVTLSVRQAMGALEITISKASDGTWNTSDILVFLKEISSDGNVNTVDVVMPSWPILVYTNPAIGKYLLLGLFQYQATGQYPNKWSVHDLGASYPNATGHNDGLDEAMPLEECGNMLIMTLSYTQHSNDTSIISTYTDLLDQWTQYLIAEALIPANQISTDDFAGALPNQTNLAIKGTIGIAAMAEIYTILGNTTMASNYSSIAASYAPQVIDFAMSTTGDHLTLNYGNESTWGLTYNLWADKHLGLNVFNESVYEMQTAWYPTVNNTYGVPLDTRHTYTKSDWQLWTAAWVTNTTVRDMFIEAEYKYVSDALNPVPYSDWYDTISGEWVGFRARPVVGGHLALLVV